MDHSSKYKENKMMEAYSLLSNTKYPDLNITKKQKKVVTGFECLFSCQILSHKNNLRSGPADFENFCLGAWQQGPFEGHI